MGTNYDEKDFKDVARGYKGFNLELIDKRVHLVSPSQRHIWTPGINVANHNLPIDPWKVDQTLAEQFHGRSNGFHSLIDPSEVYAQGYWGKNDFDPHLSPILGQVQPLGPRARGAIGFKSSHAKVTELYSEEFPCEVCGQRAERLLPQADNSLFENIFPVCDRCLKNLSKRLGSRTDVEEIGHIGKVYKDLGEYYNVPILPVRQEWKKGGL